MARAQENIANARIALNEADMALKALQTREDRRARRIARRLQADRYSSHDDGSAREGDGAMVVH